MQICNYAEIQKSRNPEMQKYKIEIATWNLRNQKQMIIILKTLTYFIHIIHAY